MDPISAAVASGMRARLDSLDMLANNIANASTAGYKVDREFYSLYRDAEAEDGMLSPVIEKPWTDFSQGTLQVTGRPLDLALNGKGFFAVNSPSGTLYTRNGSFQVAPSGDVVTAEGYTVRLEGGSVLRSTSNTPMEVAPDGTVKQGGVALGQAGSGRFSSRFADEARCQSVSSDRGRASCRGERGSGASRQAGRFKRCQRRVGRAVGRYLTTV